MSKKRENCFLSGRELRVTTDANGSRTLAGLIPYGSPSVGLPWSESIAPGAFSDALKPGADALMLRDHDPALLLGRTLSGTLTLADSAAGLQFRCVLPNTSTAADLIESMSRKDISGVSFGFADNQPDWANDGTGNLVRVLRNVSLFEISVCSFAAYPDANAALRSIVPKELRGLLKRSITEDDDSDEDSDTDCSCDCPECMAGDCEDCTNPDCDDPNCEHSGDEDGDSEDRSTWSERTLLQIEVARRK